MNCIDLMSKLSKQRKTTEAIKLDVKTSKNVELRRKHSKQRKTTKVIKLRWIACDLTSKRTKMSTQRSQTRFKLQRNLDRFDVQTVIKNIEWRCKPFDTADVQKWSNYDEFGSIWCQIHKTTQNYKNYHIRWIASIWSSKPFKTTLNYKSDQNTMNCMHLTSKRTKMSRDVANTFKTTQNYKNYQITMNCIDLMSKLIKTTQNYRICDQIGRQNEQKCWVTSQNIQNNAKLQKWSKYNDLHRFDVKYDQSNAKLQTRSNYDEFASIWRPNNQNNAKLQKQLNWTIKTSKNVELRRKHSKQRKTTKVIKLRWIACIWHQNERKCRVRSQTIQNNAKVQKWSKYNDLHRYDVKSDQITMNLDRFDVQTIKNIELRRKPFKTAKLQKWSKYNDFHRLGCQIHQNKHKTTQIIKLHELHRFDVKTIKTTQNYRSDQIGRQNEQKCWVTSKTFKTTLNYKSDQIIMNCIDLMSKRSKQRKTPNAIKLRWICIDLTSKNIQNNAKLQKRLNYNDLHRFDFKTI